MRHLRTIAAAAVLAFSFSAVPVQAQLAQTKILTEETMVPAKDAGVELYVRNKRPEGKTDFGPSRTLLFVHGATYPAETAFDLPVGGKSWMEQIAERGFDVYLVDVRGYGRSTRPKEMGAPSVENEPIVTTDVAIADVGAAVDHILKTRGLDKLHLMGWSWGTAIMAGYAQANPGKVDRLVLYAPLWKIEGAPPISAGAGKMGAYRAVKREAAFDRWVRGVPEDKKAGLIPAGWFDQWADATFASDPEGAKMSPPVLRAPNGVLLDIGRYWAKGEPTWDPAKITAPTLLLVGEWDKDTPPSMAQAIFPLLTKAPWKRLVMIGEATHTVILEKNRRQLIDAVQAFLDEPATN